MRASTPVIAVVLVVVLVASLAGCRVQRGGQSRSQAQQELSIYIPCGMLLPFVEAIKGFEQRHPGVRIKATYDNAAILVDKIVEQGDRPDLFVSPGSRELAVLEEKGLVEPGSKRALGSYEVVLIVPRGNPAGVKGWEDLTKPEVKSISVGDPDRNSVGYYSRQGLQKLGLWDKILPKMIFTHDAVEAYTAVSQRKVDAAFSYLTCPLSSNPEKLSKEKVEVIVKLPRDTYEEAKVFIAQFKTSKQKGLAAQFADYLLEPAVQQMLAEKGLPNERASSDLVVPPKG